MTDVWYALPVAEPPDLANPRLQLWRDRGYKVAVFLDPNMVVGAYNADLAFCGENGYLGYPNAVKTLCGAIMAAWPVEVIVTGGLDIDPDPLHTPQEIASDFVRRFPNTFGVMQPTGDPWMMDQDGTPAAARICGSPWMGREFIRRINQGTGPFWREYYHFYCDEEMKEVTQKLGILWQRPDLTQHHHHWSRERKPRPMHMHKAKAQWGEAKALFHSRREAGFPGHEPHP